MFNRLSNSGTGTVYTAPSIVTVRVNSSPTGSGFITVNGTAEVTPYIFAGTVGNAETLSATPPSGLQFYQLVRWRSTITHDNGSVF